MRRVGRGQLPDQPREHHRTAEATDHAGREETTGETHQVPACDQGHRREPESAQRLEDHADPGERPHRLEPLRRREGDVLEHRERQAERDDAQRVGHRRLVEHLLRQHRREERQTAAPVEHRRGQGRADRRAGRLPGARRKSPRARLAATNLVIAIRMPSPQTRAKIARIAKTMANAPSSASPESRAISNATRKVAALLITAPKMLRPPSTARLPVPWFSLTPAPVLRLLGHPHSRHRGPRDARRATAVDHGGGVPVWHAVRR